MRGSWAYLFGVEHVHDRELAEDHDHAVGGLRAAEDIGHGRDRNGRARGQWSGATTGAAASHRGRSRRSRRIGRWKTPPAHACRTVRIPGRSPVSPRPRHKATAVPPEQGGGDRLRTTASTVQALRAGRNAGGKGRVVLPDRGGLAMDRPGLRCRLRRRRGAGGCGVTLQRWLRRGGSGERSQARQRQPGEDRNRPAGTGNPHGQGWWPLKPRFITGNWVLPADRFGWRRHGGRTITTIRRFRRRLPPLSHMSPSTAARFRPGLRPPAPTVRSPRAPRPPPRPRRTAR